MAEENKNADPSEEYNDDGEKNPEYVAPKDEIESADDTEKTDTNTDTDTDKEKEEADEKVFDDTIDPETPLDIPVRDNVAQHIIARKNEKIAKLKSKLTEENEEYIAPTGEETDDDLSVEASEAIDRKLNKAIAPILGKLANVADEKEMQDLLRDEPEAKKYANHIKAYMAHDSYKGVSPKVIYHHLAWTNSQALGAKKKSAADLEASQTKSGGRSIVDNATAGDFPSADDIENMDEKEFAKMEGDALQGKFLQK